MPERRVEALWKHRTRELRTRGRRSKVYRERAEQLRRLAETEPSERLRGEWLELVQRYEALADTFADAEDEASAAG